MLEQFATEGVLDFVYHIGDLSYAVGYSSVWDDYLEMIAPFASRVGYGVNLGNHEFNWPAAGFKGRAVQSFYTGYDSGGECGVPAQRLLPMPQGESKAARGGGFDKPWWSLDVGLVHVVAMCTELDFREGKSLRHSTPRVL